MAAPEAGHALDTIVAENMTKEDAVRALLALEDEQGSGEEHIDARVLTRELEKVPTLVLYIPAPLSKEHIEKIAQWCRHEIAERLFLEVKVDGRRTGGCAFAWDGVLYDFSLDYFLSKRKEEYEALFDRIAPVS